MAYSRALDLSQPVENDLEGSVGVPSQSPLATKADCLEQILQAFRDIADHDDIHQAAHRLALVQQWICKEAECAEADEIFRDLRLV
jgi:hypothetical protein